MPSTRELVTDAMFLVGVLGQGDVAMNAGDAQIGVRMLNRMLDAWANDRLMIYTQSKEWIDLEAGTASYLTGNLQPPTLRPAAIESAAYIRHGGVDYPFELVTRNQFDRIEVKGDAGIPEYCWYEPSMEQGEFAFYPAPYAAMSAYFNVRRELTGTLTLETDIVLPPGYERAIVGNLAIDLAPAFGQNVKQEVVRMARQSRKWLKDINYVPGIMDTGLERVRSDIRTGS